MNPQPMTIAAFQKHIHERYYQADRARGTPATFMWFMEEVGELATALHRTMPVIVQTTDPKDPAHRNNLEEEFADVLAWLCTLANINDVDLDRAVKKKYLTGGGPQGHK